MCDELVDLIGIPEFFVDGFTQYVVIDGILRCVGYRKQRGPDGIENIPAFRLQITLEGATSARDQTSAALNSSAAIMASEMMINRGSVGSH